MEIPAWLYSSFWAILGFTFLHLGFNALDRTGLSDAVSPVAMSFFKHSLAISACHSSSYALIFRQRVKLTAEVRYSWVTFGTLPCLFYRHVINRTFLWGPVAFFFLRFLTWLLEFLPWLTTIYNKYTGVLTFAFISSEMYAWFFPISTSINFLFIPGKFYRNREQRICTGIHMALETSLFLISGKNSEFYPILVLLISFLTSSYWAGLSGLDPCTRVSGDPLSADEGFQELLPVAEKGKEFFQATKEKMTGKLMEFVVGMLGTILFQYFFRLTTFNHVVAFLYMVGAWVACIALVGGGSGDLGIFQFLLGNVIVGCTVSQFGLRGTTWIAYGTSVFLFGLRLKLATVAFVNRAGDQIKVVLW